MAEVKIMSTGAVEPMVKLFAPVFEREMLFERNAVRERELASASERWGARISRQSMADWVETTAV